MLALHSTNQWHFTSVSYPIVKSVVIGSRRYVIRKITNKIEKTKLKKTKKKKKFSLQKMLDNDGMDNGGNDEFK